MTQKAFALPSLLICISFAFLITLPVTSKCIKTLRYFAEEKITTDLAYLTNSKLVAKQYYQNTISSADSYLDCINEQASRSGYIYSMNFCALYFKQYPLELPILAFSNAALDYDSLNAKLNGCTTVLEALDKSYVISSGYFSNRICLLGSARQELTQIQSNLIATDKLSIYNSDFLSVNGFIHANNLHFDNQASFRLFAAGEVIIDRLSADRNIDLQIISASGQIKIAHVDKKIRLAAFSKKEIRLPAGVTYYKQGLQEYSLSKLALGFSLQD